VISFSVAAMGLAFLDFFIIQADRVMIGYYLDVREVGIYSVGWSLVAYLSIVLSSVNQVFAPTIADLHARGQRELLGRMFQTLTKWIFGLTVPLAAVLILFAAPLMRIFGQDFEAGWPVLVIGAIGQLVNCGVGSSGTLLLMSGNQKTLIWIQAGSAVLTVVLNLLFIPQWGIVGASIASAVTVVVTNVAYLSRVRQSLGLSPYNRSYLRLASPLLGSVGIVLLARALLGVSQREWLVIGIGLVLAYAAFIGISLAAGLDADDRIVAQAAWSKISALYPKRETDS
jgi:O-antigen/teichoic acid export membrane protein